MNRIFIDMDGVLANFYGLRQKLDIWDESLKKIPGAFKDLDPMPGALDAVKELTELGYECWVATKPPHDVAQAYADKADWIFRHLPDLQRRIILTQDKGLLGDRDDYLIDDRPHKANCDQFAGALIHFKHQTLWPPVLEYFRALGKPPEWIRPGLNRRTPL